MKTDKCVKISQKQLKINSSSSDNYEIHWQETIEISAKHNNKQRSLSSVNLQSKI